MSDTMLTPDDSGACRLLLTTGETRTILFGLSEGMNPEFTAVLMKHVTCTKTAGGCNGTGTKKDTKGIVRVCNRCRGSGLIAVKNDINGRIELPMGISSVESMGDTANKEGLIYYAFDLKAPEDLVAEETWFGVIRAGGEDVCRFTTTILKPIRVCDL